MTPNDKQIDLLMRRYAQKASRAAAGEHLDADEMNAFAEARLSPAARAHYVSHLADCERCRQQVTQLALSGGAAIGRETVVSAKEHRTFWQVFTGLFALPVLRYAAFAAVVLIVAGVSYIALRQPRPPSTLIASNEQTDRPAASGANQPEFLDRSSNANTQERSTRTTSPTEASRSSEEGAKRDDSTLAESLSPTPQPMKEAPPAFPPAAKKAGEPDVATNFPYAPPPPGEVQTRQQPATAGIFSAEQRKAEAVDKLAADRDRAGNFTKDAKADDAFRTAGNQAAAPRKSVDEKPKGPSRNFENMQANQRANENRAESPKTSEREVDKGTSSEEEKPARSVGGHKFRKQGNAWVDEKFKSSMTLKSISRGSDEFNELDSGLRSIAQQLSGEVIVVWKGKAYVIR